MPPHVSRKTNLKEKQNAKQAKSANADEKKRLLEMGLDKTMKKAIKDDSVTCTKCKATKQGPKSCTCKGGGSRPDSQTSDDSIKILLAAAKVRHEASLKSKEAQRLKESDAKQKEREKKKQNQAMAGLGMGDPNEILQGDENYVLQIVEFPIAKLGFSLEKNAICKINPEVLKKNEVDVKVGWAIAAVNGEDIETPITKKSIMTQCKKAMKSGFLKILFAVALDPEATKHCMLCNKFVAVGEFSEDQLAEGPGIQVCGDCEEYADMGMF